jgi:UDP-N-acetylglucosamine 2-epimerase
VIFSAHPRTRKRIEAADVTFSPLVRLMKPLGFLDYVKLQMSAQVVISDSGTITEESSILNFPAINLREAHERPEGVEEGAVIMAGLDADRVMLAIEVLSCQKRGTVRSIRQVADYTMSNVAEKVARTIISYTGYVNRTVWRKPDA